MYPWIQWKSGVRPEMEMMSWWFNDIMSVISNLFVHNEHGNACHMASLMLCCLMKKQGYDVKVLQGYSNINAGVRSSTLHYWVELQEGNTTVWLDISLKILYEFGWDRHVLLYYDDNSVELKKGYNYLIGDDDAELRKMYDMYRDDYDNYFSLPNIPRFVRDFYEDLKAH